MRCMGQLNVGTRCGTIEVCRRQSSWWGAADRWIMWWRQVYIKAKACITRPMTYSSSSSSSSGGGHGVAALFTELLVRAERHCTGTLQLQCTHTHPAHDAVCCLLCDRWLAMHNLGNTRKYINLGLKITMHCKFLISTCTNTLAYLLTHQMWHIRHFWWKCDDTLAKTF